MRHRNKSNKLEVIRLTGIRSVTWDIKQSIPEKQSRSKQNNRSSTFIFSKRRNGSEELITVEMFKTEEPGVKPEGRHL